jgi:hypothetical protein
LSGAALEGDMAFVVLKPVLVVVAVVSLGIWWVAV